MNSCDKQFLTEASGQVHHKRNPQVLLQKVKPNAVHCMIWIAYTLHPGSFFLQVATAFCIVLRIACQPILQTFQHLFLQAALGREHKKRPTCSDEFPQPVRTRGLEKTSAELFLQERCSLYNRGITNKPLSEELARYTP